MPAFIVQKIEKRNYSSDIEVAIKYYTILFSLNNIHLSAKEIELISFTAVKGTITSPTSRSEFVEMFDSSQASLENIKGRLVKRKFLVKKEGKHKVHPSLVLDFSTELVLQIRLAKKPIPVIKINNAEELEEVLKEN
jgi:hypothetical protein